MSIIWGGTWGVQSDFRGVQCYPGLPSSSATDCRGITLLSIPSKIMANTIVQRLTEAVDEKFRKEQAGFHKRRGCIDQIFALRNIIEQCTEWQRQIYINFIDFEKVFNSIHRDGLWNILKRPCH